jgi:phytoene/squalene synthetase
LAGIGETGLKTLLATPGKQAIAAGAGFGGIAIGTPRSTLEARWQPFMLAQIERTRKMLQAAAPLGLVLQGRIGFETRMIIVGGERILRKLYLDPPAPLTYRVKLNAWDWTVIITRALLKK